MSRPLIVRIKKSPDGHTALTCIRPDGSSTWQRQEGAVARFFPRHDLTHFAVESVLGLNSGFYGLVSEGWDLSDFGTPWPRGPLPFEARLSERIVGFFDRDRSTGTMGDADELNADLAESLGDDEQNLRAFTNDDLAAVRQRRGELFTRWDAIKPGDALELPFVIAAPAGMRGE
jgi:hypothetical protein